MKKDEIMIDDENLKMLNIGTALSKYFKVLLEDCNFGKNQTGKYKKFTRMDKKTIRIIPFMV